MVVIFIYPVRLDLNQAFGNQKWFGEAKRRKESTILWYFLFKQNEEGFSRYPVPGAKP